MWTSLDIGIKFDRPTNIRAQLDKMANGGKAKAPSKTPDIPELGRRSSYLSREPYSHTTPTVEGAQASPNEDSTLSSLDPAARFAALKAFYKNQITSTTTNDASLPSNSGDFSYSSPASLARIINLYSSSGNFQPKKKPKMPLMREALYASEGLHLPDPTTALIIHAKILSGGFSNTTSLSQRRFQIGPGGGNPEARFVEELRPMPAPLTTKIAKRCKGCRHILVKPEAKPTSTRHRIKLVALAYIPHVSLKSLPGSSGSATAGPPLTGPSALLGSDIVLDPGRPTQWLLTLKNPLFDAVKVSIATPAVTPGKWGHRVTILCPQFEVGANSDVWEEALGSKSGKGAISAGTSGSGSGGGVAEAGKVYDRGKNWTSVVLEVVPVGVVASIASEGEEGRLGEDEDVLEIPIRVRLEWRQGDLDDGASKKAKLNEEGMDDGRRELAYWMVLGVGRVKMG
jgi:dynactin 4